MKRFATLATLAALSLCAAPVRSQLPPIPNISVLVCETYADLQYQSCVSLQDNYWLDSQCETQGLIAFIACFSV
jgi:hypothetical protein